MKPYHRKSTEETGQELMAAPRSFGAPPENGVENPDIPVLKEKEKEKKGAGVPWYGGTTAGTPGMTLGSLSGSAQVGASLSRMGFLGSGRIAAALANLFGGPGTFLGGLFASQFGSALVLAGMAAWAAVIAFAGYTLWNGMSKPEASALPSFPSLDGVGPSGIQIDKPKDRSLDYVGKANQGEVVWDKDNPLAPKEAPKEQPKPQPEAKPEPPKTPQFQMPSMNDLAKQKGLDPNGFVKKLTQDPGQLNGVGAGPKLKDGQSGFNLTKTFTPNGVGPRQKLQALKRPMDNHGVRGGSQTQAVATRAMGQLKFANDQSRTGSYATQSDPAKQSETNAFEQGKPPAGGDALGVTDPGGIVVPPGNGFTPPDIPSIPNPQNVTPYQQQVDNAKNAGSMAGALLAAGLIMIMIGMMLIAAGVALMGNWTTLPIGIALVAMGMMMVMIGMILLAMAAMMAALGNQNAQQVGQPFGQQQQGANASDCVNQAHMQGTSVDKVCPQNGAPPAGQVPLDGGFTMVPQAVSAEQNAPTAH